ncbi:MAG: hypothetical protein KF744_09175 [Taibaiella sp.]|nr:hypothetical protein [Taibaiella sp.]
MVNKHFIEQLEYLVDMYKKYMDAGSNRQALKTGMKLIKLVEKNEGCLMQPELKMKVVETNGGEEVE